jgi:hypothetical protein
MLRTNNLLFHNSPLGEIHHGFIVLGLGVTANDVVKDLSAAIRPWRCSVQSSRVLKFQELENFLLRWLKEIRLSEIQKRARVRFLDDVSRKVCFP